MLFNSIDFAYFLPLVFGLYWLLAKRGLKLQNLFLVICSYVFYGWWDPRFLSLILISTLVDFWVGRSMEGQVDARKRKRLLYVSIFVNLGFLGVFKYFNFFLDNFVSAFSFFGYALDMPSLKIILPVGISFYTFQTLSYTIDIYRGNLKATRDFISFAAFVSFFPQLVAGPIERASNLLPQFYKERSFDYAKAVDGLRQILWGFFKKVVIADNCAEYANVIFNNSQDYSGSTLFIGAVFFAFQIYGDFSGYSDIAIGTSRLFGFNLRRNFAFPYFSRDIAEFWRRWHISLSTWFRDYLYIPLGGSRGTRWNQVRNTFIVFTVSGFWHGANWTFVIWGALNALYFLPLLLRGKNRVNMENVASGRVFPTFRELGAILSTFALTVLAWIFFRAENVEHAFDILASIFSSEILSPIQIIDSMSLPYIGMGILLLVFLLIEWAGREGQYAIEKLGFAWKRPVRLSFYLAIGLVIIFFGNFNKTEFIYFAF